MSDLPAWLIVAMLLFVAVALVATGTRLAAILERIARALENRRE